VSALQRYLKNLLIIIYYSFDIAVPDWVAAYEINEYFSLSPLSAVVTMLCTFLLLSGASISAKANLAITVFNLVLLLTFIGMGSLYVDPANWNPFLPFGIQGTWRGVGLVFFSYPLK
jgi:APA family basic amino acid/polyamine antiporter